MVNTVTGSVTLDGLIADSYAYITDSGTILSGEDLARGCVLGKVTASGKLVACDHTASDGSESPYAVLAVATDASGGDVENALIITSGRFDEAKLTFGGSSTISDLEDAMRLNNLYVKTVASMI